MYKALSLLICTIVSLCTSCTPRPSEPPMTQLEIRVAQTREFETTDTKLVMKSMMNVLQDEGYIIKNAVLDLGLLSAEKQVDIENKTEAFFAVCALGNQARWNKHQVLEASANVSDFGNQTRVRINFQFKTFDNFGCVKDIKEIKDPEIYQTFFTKVNKGIFLQQEGV